MDALPTPTGIGHDPDAFERFFRAHVRDVERFIARRTDDPQQAADLTAEVFLAVIEHADGYRPERGSTVAWVFGIARNVIAEHGRRRARDLRLVRRVSGRALLDEDSLARIEERLDAEREARRTIAALAGLSPADRALVELVAVDGLGIDDVAAVLGVEPGTARVRLHRARRRLTALVASATLTPTEA
ncbi:MAG: sigma-70 family RNA polymerase sigma factor [Micropruina sp.]|nr:MAG: sigma-70 family RNA polymerase sigma factor [Micropruina sp.]